MMNARFSQQLSSPLEGVSARAWERFARTLEVQTPTAISKSGGFGAYDMRPFRLVELGYAKKLPPTRNSEGRQIQACAFLLPWTEKRFLTDAFVQKEAFSKSNSLYHRALMSGELKRPADCSVSGALFLLHRGGKSALAWTDLFDDTRELYERVKGIF